MISRRWKRRSPALRVERVPQIANFTPPMKQVSKFSLSTLGKSEPIRDGFPWQPRITKSNEKGPTMSIPKAAYVLVHGGWHNQSAWDKVTPILEAQGHTVLT